MENMQWFMLPKNSNVLWKLRLVNFSPTDTNLQHIPLKRAENFLLEGIYCNFIEIFSGFGLLATALKPCPNHGFFHRTVFANTVNEYTISQFCSARFCWKWKIVEIQLLPSHFSRSCTIEHGKTEISCVRWPCWVKMLEMTGNYVCIRFRRF